MNHDFAFSVVVRPPIPPQSSAIADAILKEVVGQDKAAEMLLSPPADVTETLDDTFQGMTWILK